MALHRRLFGVLSCLALTSCASAQKVDVAGPAGAQEKKLSARVEAQIKILERLSAKSKLTCENLNTWEGVIRVDDIEYFFGNRRDQFVELTRGFTSGMANAPAEFRKKGTAIVTFSLDAANDRLYSRFEGESVDVVDPAKGTSLGVDLMPFNQVSIITPEAYIHFQPNIHHAQPEGKRVRAAFCDGPEKAREQIWGAIVDPRLLLGYGRTTWENLDLLIRALRENGGLGVDGAKLQIVSNGVKLHVSSNGAISLDDAAASDSVETLIIMPGMIGHGRLIYQDMKFIDDNLVSLTVREGNGNVHQILRWSYMEQNGVDVPSGLIYKAVDDGQRFTFQRTLHVLGSTPHPSIAPATFTRGNIGLVEGDHFVDHVAGVVSRFDNGELRSLSDEQSREWLAPR